QASVGSLGRVARPIRDTSSQAAHAEADPGIARGGKAGFHLDRKLGTSDAPRRGIGSRWCDLGRSHTFGAHLGMKTDEPGQFTQQNYFDCRLNSAGIPDFSGLRRKASRSAIAFSSSEAICASAQPIAFPIASAAAVLQSSDQQPPSPTGTRRSRTSANVTAYSF